MAEGQAEEQSNSVLVPGFLRGWQEPLKEQSDLKLKKKKSNERNLKITRPEGAKKNRILICRSG